MLNSLLFYDAGMIILFGANLAQLVISVCFCGALRGVLALKLNLAKSEPISFAEVLQVAALVAILGGGLARFQ